MSVYNDQGYRDREHYLQCLAEDCGVSIAIVSALAELLGESEDFDGLINAVEDASEDFD